MKKQTFSIFVMLLCAFTLFAEGGFSVKAISQVPLFREPVADPYAFSTHLSVVKALDSDNKPDSIYSIITEKDKHSDEYRVFYDYLHYDNTSQLPESNMYINMKTGASVGLLRMRYEGNDIVPSIDFELNIAGYINTIFCMFGKNDTLDFDGSYFLGASARVADIVSVRFGLHHFSGHYGDEMLQKYFEFNKVNSSSTFNSGSLFNYAKGDSNHDYYLISPIEYVRDNSWIFGVSADVPAKAFGLRVYSEAELPKNPSWFRPLVHVPADYDNPVDESERPTLIDRIGGTPSDGEQFPQSQLDAEQDLKRTANGAYRAWRIHTGLEARYNLSFGAVFMAADVQFHQDGQTKHQIGAYSKDNPWEVELTIGGGLELGHLLGDGKTARIEVYYHNGRVPATQFFYQRMPCITVGLGIN